MKTIEEAQALLLEALQYRPVTKAEMGEKTYKVTYALQLLSKEKSEGFTNSADRLAEKIQELNVQVDLQTQYVINKAIARSLSDFEQDIYSPIETKNVPKGFSSN